ncbi:MAG: MFS transporter, partial [Actinomycetaceae bacterium]|nr:MFS transporter [Actinomycetaceae bacterium]
MSETQVAVEETVASEEKKSGFHYAWVVFLATIVMTFVYSIVFNTFSLYAADIAASKAFDNNRTMYSIVPTLHSVGATIFLLSYGKIVKKVKFRGVILLGGLGIALGYLLYSVANNAALFYLAALFVGMYPAFCSSSTTGALLNRWYGKYNTTLLSISMAIGGFGGTLGAIIVGKLLGSVGYQNSLRYMAILAVVATLIVVFTVRNAPQDMGAGILWPSEVDKTATSQEERAGYTFAQAIRTYSFWAIMLFFMLFAGSFYAIYSNLGLF